jgi:hypothetical protein
MPKRLYPTKAISEIRKEITKTTASKTTSLCKYILKIVTLISKVPGYPDSVVSSIDQPLNPNLFHRSAPYPATDNLPGTSIPEVEQSPEAAVYTIDREFAAAASSVLILRSWLLLPV